MNFMEKRILEEATVAPDGVLKMDSFLNHQAEISSAAWDTIWRLWTLWTPARLRSANSDNCVVNLDLFLWLC